MSIVQPSHILGMNARIQEYTAQNAASAKKLGFSKLRTKSFLKKHGISVPELYAVIHSREELREFDWQSIKSSFAVKPASGSAGKGILVIKKKVRNKPLWIDVEGNEYSAQDLNLHVADILEGQYTTWGTKHMALIEERIEIHPDLEPYVEIGTPDIRVILFKNIPVMAMARLPTKESDGRANLDQGAIAVGIDFGTGKSTYAVSGKKKTIKYFPHNHLPVAGIQIPYWKEVLRTAVRVANATGYRYLGVDIFIDSQKGPVVAEVNGFPGLSIQLANRAGLRRRLERLRDVEATNVNHAVRIAQAIFAENYPSSATELDMMILSPMEKVEIFGDDDQVREVIGLMNTGRERSVINLDVVKELGLFDSEDTLWKQHIDGEGKLPFVEVKYKLRDRIFTTTMAVAKSLSNRQWDVELGRKDLKGFLVGAEER